MVVLFWQYYYSVRSIRMIILFANKKTFGARSLEIFIVNRFERKIIKIDLLVRSGQLLESFSEIRSELLSYHICLFFFPCDIYEGNSFCVCVKSFISFGSALILALFMKFLV